MDKKYLHIVVLLPLFSLVYCGTSFHRGPGVSVVNLKAHAARPFEEVKARWTTSFTLPDPLFKESDSSLPPLLAPPDLGVITIHSILYGEEMIDASVQKSCAEESLSFEEAYKEYDSKHQPEDQFRIELRLQTHFSEHSLEPELWTIYLEDDQGVMYESLSIRKGDINTEEKEIPSPYHSFPVKIKRVTRTIDLYFPRITFFGKELLSGQTKFLRLVFSQQKRAVGEAKWVFDFNEGEKSLDN